MEDRHLRTEHLRADLRARAVRGAAVALGTRAVSAGINFVSLAVLARLLVKDDFGLVFTIAAIAGLVASFENFGLGTATLQRRDLSDRQVSTLFWVNVSLSTAVMLLIVALAPAIVGIYGDPRLGPLALAFAAMALLGGFEVQHRALLLRQMNFPSLAVIDIVSLAVGACSGFAAAWYGAGYWALVVQAGTVALLKTAGVWVACAWRPGRPGTLADVRPLLSFGGNLTLGHLLFDVSANADKILLGRFVGTASTGIYGNAFRLLLLPASHIDRPLTAVAVGALSRLQDEPARFRAYYQKAMLLLASAALPFGVFVFVAAEPVVLAALGAHWLEAVPIVRILTPAALVETLGSATSWVYSAIGRTDRQARWAVLASVVRLVAVSAGVAWGAAGVAAATSLSTVSLRYWGITYCFRESPLHVRDLGNALWRPALASLIAGTCLFVAGGSGGAPVATVLGDLTIFALVYAAAWVILPGGRTALREMTALTRDLRSARGTVQTLATTGVGSTPLERSTP